MVRNEVHSIHTNRKRNMAYPLTQHNGYWAQVICDLEAQEAPAPEGGQCCRDENQGRGPDCPDHPRAESSAWPVVLIVCLAIGFVAYVITHKRLGDSLRTVQVGK